MFTVSGTTTTPTLTDNGTVTVPTFATPAAVPQPGSPDGLDSSDTRLTQAVAAVDPQLKAFAVWTQHTVAGSAGGPSVVRWYELKAGVSAPSPVQTGTVAVNGAFAFNGAISPTAQGNAAAIDYNVGSSTMKVQVRAQDHLPGTAAGSMTNETTLASSPGINADFSCPSQDGGTSSSCRWGDFAGASPDPTCAAQVWGTNQLNGATSSGTATWASQNFRLQLDECPTAAFTSAPSPPTHASPVTFDGSGATDSDGSISSYKWNFGDGVSSTLTTASTTHTYALPGTFHVTLTVTDNSGLTGTVTHTVAVN
jgi:PKD repeat protein